MNKLVKLVCFAVALVTMASCCGGGIPDEVCISRSVLLDKIKGGWAGQTIGCTYGGPTEFKHNGTMIQDYIPITWEDGCIMDCMRRNPGLYDDIYMDLTFMEVFDRLGLDAPVDSFAVAFARAGYPLWHANQAARYNILNGIMPPESGHWLNNPHADDLDFQIEADFSGLMSPGMPNSAAEVCDRIGHIMNYGDGWYGGVYVGAMYSLAFVSDDVQLIAREALKVIPEGTRYHSCMRDILSWHEKYPDDWQMTWLEVQRHYSEDIGCPDGVFKPFDIDAVVNSAYILIGLLYGEKDFFKTMDIATRCGQDSDCNPASAAGILGTIIGYDAIPEKWMKNLRDCEDIPFAYTSSSLKRTYEMGLDQALQMIERGGGRIEGDNVTIKCQKPVPVRYEKAFELMRAVARDLLNRKVQNFGEYKFEGNGFAMRGGPRHSSNPAYVAKLEVIVDGEVVQEISLPVNHHDRSAELGWKYGLPMGSHTLTLNWLNPEDGASLNCSEIIVYAE